MIRIYVTAMRGGSTNGPDACLHHELDATPWFEQATDEQLQKLQAEHHASSEGGVHQNYFAGIRTDDVFGWLAENAPSALSQEIIDYCDKFKVSWLAELSGRDVRRWMVQHNARQAATTAVDQLLSQ